MCHWDHQICVTSLQTSNSKDLWIPQPFTSHVLGLELHQVEPQGVKPTHSDAPAWLPRLVAEWIMTFVAVGLSVARRVSNDHGQLLICFPWEVRGSDQGT